MAKNKSLTKSVHNKKQVKQELAGTIEAALPEIKARLGKKKFNKRIQKATNLLTQGLHLKHADKEKKNSENHKQAENKGVQKKSSNKSTAI